MEIYVYFGKMILSTWSSNYVLLKLMLNRLTRMTVNLKYFNFSTISIKRWGGEFEISSFGSKEEERTYNSGNWYLCIRIITCNMFFFISSNTTQLTFPCSKSTIEILQKCVKYMLKVNNKNTGTTSMSDFIKAKTGIYYCPLAVPEKVLTKVMEVIKRSLNVMQWNFHYFLHLAILGYTFLLFFTWSKL